MLAIRRNYDETHACKLLTSLKQFGRNLISCFLAVIGRQQKLIAVLLLCVYDMHREFLTLGALILSQTVLAWDGYCEVSIPHYLMFKVKLHSCQKVGSQPDQYHVCCWRGSGERDPQCHTQDLPGNNKAATASYYNIMDGNMHVAKCMIKPVVRQCYWIFQTDYGPQYKDVQPGACEHVRGKGGRLWYTCCSTSDPKDHRQPLFCQSQDNSRNSFEKIGPNYAWSVVPSSFTGGLTPLVSILRWTGSIYCYES